MYEFDENSEEFTSAENDAEEVLEELDENEEEPEEQAVSVSDRAKARIEEANLWSLLISHTFFTEKSARPEIVSSVSRKLRQFATKELEILLGMRQDERLAPKVQAAAPAQFNGEEVHVLKMLIGKVLKRDGPIASAPSTAQPEIVTLAVPSEPGINKLGPVDKPSAEPVKKKRRSMSEISEDIKKNNKLPIKSESKGPKANSFAKPNANTKPKAMPTADSLLQTGHFTTPQLNLTGENVSGKQMQQGANLLSSVVQQLTGGGHSIAVDNSKPADSANDGGDINERF